MNIEEARQVLWLKSDQRPLGDLLDEGYLTEERLKWAAQRAYNPKLKEASQILLNQKLSPRVSKQEALQVSPFELGISLKDAQSTPWPFNPYKGQPMGTLIASKQLSLKDLGYAIETAWDPKVKQAAIALSLVRLEQTVKEPAISSGNVKVISGGRSYANWKQLQLSYLQGFFIGIFFTILIGWGLLSLFNDSKRQGANSVVSLNELFSSPEKIIALVTVVVFFIFLMWLFSFLPNQIEKRFEKQIEAYRLGEKGEERVVQQVIQVLDGNWALFQNINLPGRNKADLDIVLVGPPGVWALEVKNYSGEYRNIGDRWEYRSGKIWKKASSNPSQQALQGAVRLANFLKVDRLNIFVNPVVVWVSENSDLQIENPYVAVWLFDRLSDELGNIWQGEKISKQEKKKIILKLSKLSEKKKR